MGTSILSGSGAPSGALGNVGDSYISTANGYFYVKTGATTWTLSTSIIGPTGVTGTTGAAGPAGPTGATGAAGGLGTVTGYSSTLACTGTNTGIVTLSASCTTGQIVTGGCATSDTASADWLSSSYPASSTQWSCKFYCGGNSTLTAYARCS
jgi:hypothetical protein